MGRIGLIGENSIEYIEKLIDIWNNGDSAVLIDWRIPYQTAVAMLKEASVEKCYIEKMLLEKAFKENLFDIEYIAFEKKSNSAEMLPNDIYDKFKENYSKDEAIILYSSGTTGKAKGIILSHYAINTNADSIIDYMELTKDDCIYIAKTISHSSTITGELLTALKVHMKLVITPTIVPPRFVLNNIEKFTVTIICVNPTLLSVYCEEYLRGSYDLSSIRTIYVSGSIMNNKIYEQAHDTFNHVAIYNVYGLSEAAPRVTAQRKDCCKGNSVGKPIKGVEVIIVDENGNELKQYEHGIVHVNTPSRFYGYITKNSKLPPFYKDWLNTGDIGYWDENDELRIINRVDDVIIIDSHKIYPSEVEQQIINNTSISECVVVKLDINGNEFIGCLYTGEQEIYANVREKLMKVLMSYEIPRFFLKYNYIPQTINGKISMNEVNELLMKELNRR